MDNNSDFIFIEDCKNDVSRLMNEIELKCDKLEILYRDYLREAVKQKDYLMSLDTMSVSYTHLTLPTKRIV